MAVFTKKTWKDRLSEYPNRRKLTKENGTTELVTVARCEGKVSQEGDAFSKDNMNDLESRIQKAIGAGDIPKALGSDIVSALTALNTEMTTIVPDKVQEYVATHKSELQGSKGDQGAAAGFGTPTATIDGNVGTPSVTVTATGSNTSKVFNFTFKNLKGDKGDKGDTGSSGSPWGGGTFNGAVSIKDTVPLKLGDWGLYSEGGQMIKLQPPESKFALTAGVTEGLWAFNPYTNAVVALGTPNKRWSQIYSSSSVISTSDRNKKKDINPISDKYLEFFALLQPVTYRFIDGDSGRMHIGFISQDVEGALAQCGLSDLDFAGFCKDKKKVAVQSPQQQFDDLGNPIMEEYESTTYEDELDSDGNPIYIYSLRYEEFIALNTAVIQMQQVKINSMEQRLEELEKKIATGL